MKGTSVFRGIFQFTINSFSKNTTLRLVFGAPSLLLREEFSSTQSSQWWGTNNKERDIKSGSLAKNGRDWPTGLLWIVYL